jgi:hypothetical protein
MIDDAPAHVFNGLCPYCGGPVQLVTGKAVYPHRPDLFAKKFWMCKPCNAYVGCHKKTDRPLGRLADARLRHWKMQAHTAFDPIWKTAKKADQAKERTQAYIWLASQMGLDTKDCHIGMFDAEQCKLVIAKVWWSQAWLGPQRAAGLEKIKNYKGESWRMQGESNGD